MIVIRDVFLFLVGLAAGVGTALLILVVLWIWRQSDYKSGEGR